jgi:sigma-B regulation protein RsbU (phosphoserine phosphatase)
MKRGFYISLILAVAGGAFISAGLFGVWAWVTTKNIMFRQVVSDLRDDGAAAQASLLVGTNLALDELKGDAAELSATSSEHSLALIARDLDLLVRSHERFLGDRVIDADGKPLAARGSLGTIEPLNNTAVRYALGGEKFVSQVYFSSVFRRYIVYLAVPIRDRKGAIIGALTCHYDLQTDLEDIFRGLRFGQSGYVQVVSDQGRVIAPPNAGGLNDDVSAYPAVQRAQRGDTGWVIAVDKAGLKRLFFYRPFDFPATLNRQHLIMLVETNEQDALAPISAARLQFLMGMGLLTILAALSGYIVSLSMVRPVNSLNEFVKKVEAGELSARLLIREKDEIGRLGTALNDMARGLEELEKIKEALIASQQVLQVARGIQMGLLPRKFPAFPDLPQVDIFGMVRPALEVGGDLFNFFRLDENRICFMVGDVSDKGVPAALFMAMALTSFEISAMPSPAADRGRRRADSIAAVLGRVNHFLNANNDSQMFVTLFAGILDLRDGSIEYSDGGHEPPFIVRRGAGVEMLQKKGGIALGFIDPYDFTVGTIKLEPGDALVLYTDGVNEAMNGDRRMFTTSAIGDTLRTISKDNPADRICQTIIGKVDEFVHGAPQSDDITLVVIRYCGPEASKASADPLQLSVPV